MGRSLFARERELEAIAFALANASAGSGSVVVVEGPAGIGKTSLLAAGRDRARAEGVLVLDGRGGELERDDAFGVVRQCFEPVLRRMTVAERERLLQGAAGLAAPAVFEPPDASVGAAPVGVLHGLYWLLDGLCQRAPVLLVVDDVQWADPASIRFLGYLARRVESLGMVLAMGLRSDDRDRGPSAIDEIHGDPVAVILRPRSLDEQAVIEFLRGVARSDVDPEFGRACEKASGGNPFLLGELARALLENQVPFTAAGVARVREITPPGVAQRLRARLARLSAPALALVDAVAVLGDDTSLELASALAGGVSEPGEAARELTIAGLLDDAMPLRFRHPILRRAVLDGIGAHDLDDAHVRAATLLRARVALPERTAIHLLATSPAGRQETVVGLRAGAEQAKARGAADVAATLLRRALAEPPEAALRAQLLLELGRMEFAAGEGSAAADHLAEAYGEAQDPVTRARAIVGLMHARGGEFADPTSIRQWIGPTLDALGDGDRELALQLNAIALLVGLRGPEDPFMEEALRLPGDTPGEATLLAHLIYLRMRPDATAAEIAELALRAARQVDVVGDDGLTGTALSAVLLGLRWSDRLDAAERILDAAISRAQRAGSLPYFAIASAHRALVRRRRGRLREAEADARAVLDSDAVGVPWQAVGATTSLVLCQLDAGRLDEAWRAFAGAGLDGHLPDRPVFMAMLLARMQVHAARGDGARALEDYREALRRRRSLGGVTASWIEDGLRAAEVHDALGDRDAALALADEMLVLARRWDTPGAIGQALRTHARLGAGGDSIQTLQEAIALLERSPARLEHARALVDLGGTLRRRGYRRDARHPLRSGYQLAGECGADALAEYARTELQASGVRLRREALRGADSLTPSERRIAEMAASGASNVEIAQALFVTLKTVEMHLTHTYRKLEITKRAELPEALADAGDQPT